MTATASIAEDLGRIEGLVARAKAEVETGMTIDLSPLDARIGKICERIAGLPAADGRVLRVRLIALYDELGTLADAIQETVQTLETTLGDNAKRRQAVTAYGQPPPGKTQSDT